MARVQKQSFRERMIAGRKKRGNMWGYVFMFILTSVAIVMSFYVGFIEISDGVHTLNISGSDIIFGNSGPSCVLEAQETCVAPLPMTITLIKNNLFIAIYAGAILNIVLALFIRKFRSFTYVIAAIYIAIAVFVSLAPNIIQLTDGVNDIRAIVKPTLNSGGTTMVILSGLAAFGNLIVYRSSGNA